MIWTATTAPDTFPPARQQSGGGERGRSLLVTAIEHALYGVLAFTIGLGDIFYHGTLNR